MITASREGGLVRLSFDYDADLVARVKTLPLADYNRDSRTWTALWCAQTFDSLLALHRAGKLRAHPGSLLRAGEEVPAAAAATLRPGSAARPYLVVTVARDDLLHARLRQVDGHRWEAKAHGYSYPATAAAALAGLVDAGTIADPDRMLDGSDAGGVTVLFNPTSGEFVCRGDDRAQPVFDQFFPARDVVAAWASKGIDVSFANSFTAEVYRGEIARNGPGLQPEGLQLTLYPYQARTVAAALERSGFGIFDAPGLGKTGQGIAVGLELLRRREVRRVLVIAPGAVRTQWKREIVRFTDCLPDDVTVIHGTPKQRDTAFAAAQDSPWVVTNYDLLITADAERIHALADGALVIFDECHRLKSPKAKRTKSARVVAQRASRRLGLSGTPVLNNAAEWHALVNDILVPGSLGSWTDYGTRYMYRSRFAKSHVPVFEGLRASMVPELTRRSKPHFARHTKSEVAEHLPPIQVQHLPLDPDPAYASVLRRAHRDAIKELSQAAKDRNSRRNPWAGVLDGEMDKEVEDGAAMTAVGMLRMLCVSPRLLRSSDSPAARTLIEGGHVPDSDGPKLDELRVMAAELQAAGERAVVFTCFSRMVELVSQRLTEDGIRHVVFTGETPDAARVAAVDAFTSAPTDSNPGPTLFLATDAAAEGLNLSHYCSRVIQLDLPWVPATAIQRINRIHRLDSTRPSYHVVNMTIHGSVEDGLLQLVGSKADLADAILGEQGSRKLATGRTGASVFEVALKDWSEAA